MNVENLGIVAMLVMETADWQRNPCFSLKKLKIRRNEIERIKHNLKKKKWPDVPQYIAQITV